jgi:hypothetical protein
MEYHDAHDAWEALRESELCYNMEFEEFKEKYQQPLFKEWLISAGGKK